MNAPYRLVPAFTLLLVSLSLQTVRGADSPPVTALKAAGANVYTIKEGVRTGVSFQNFKLDEAAWKALEALPDLKNFNISGSGKEFGNEQMARLCEIKTIETIFMNGFGGTEEGLAALAKLPQLRHFGADHSPFTGAGLIALKGCKDFVSIRLGGCPFDDNGMKALGELTQLKEANISHVRFTSVGFPYFSKLINLEKLTISPNFSPYFVGTDFAHLSGLKNLQTLVVTEMALTYDDGLEYLKGLPLKRLELNDCRVSDADLEKLKAVLPGTMIDRIYSIDKKYQRWDIELENRKKLKMK